MNALSVVVNHNGGKLHTGARDARGLPRDHHLRLYIKQLEYIKPWVKESVSENVILMGNDAKVVLNGLSNIGVNIASFVKIFVKAKKVFDYKSINTSFYFEKCLVSSKQLVEGNKYLYS